MAAMLTSVAAVLQYIEISVPIMPSFVKLDMSDLPALSRSSFAPLSRTYSSSARAKTVGE